MSVRATGDDELSQEQSEGEPEQPRGERVPSGTQCGGFDRGREVGAFQGPSRSAIEQLDSWSQARTAAGPRNVMSLQSKQKKFLTLKSYVYANVVLMQY